MRAAALLAFIAILLAGLIVEGGLRLYAELRAPRFVGAAVPADDTQPDPLLVAWLKPNYVGPDGSPAYDSRGFRLNGEPRPENFSSPLVVLGGSTAYGWDAPDDETIPALLERLVRNGSDPTAVVLNAGFPGLTTLDTLLVYDAKVASLHPSRVVVLAGLNDLYYAVDWSPNGRLRWTTRTYELGLRARHDPQLRPLVDAINRYALGNCYTCYALGTGLSGLYDRTGFLPILRAADWFGQEPFDSVNTRAMQLTAWSIGELARRVGADGGCLIVAWQPMAGVPDGARTNDQQLALKELAIRAPGWSKLAPMMFSELRRETLLALAQTPAVEVDLTRLFDAEERPVFQGDAVHYTLLGNRLIAEALAPAASQTTCGQ